jgi:phage shock protein E
MNKIAELLKTGEAVVVDVRTPQEFMGGHVAGSINIPINEVPMRLNDFKKMKNIILCCASGARSQNAAFYLQQQGIECVNGGPWVEVNYYSNNNN